MKITRHNYEEYFILYMDNELSNDDRRLVEAFVQQHPDLKEELAILLQYKMVPDTDIVFSSKEELMKVNGDTPVTLSNYEEWLVLYMDNELTAEQKNKVEQFLAVNSSVKKEFALLQRTKLQPEQIFFANKEELYRREEKVRLLPVRWWRVAAAVLILATGITTLVVLNNKPSANKGTEVATIPVNEQKTTDNNSQGVQPYDNKAAANTDEKNMPVNSPVVAESVKPNFTPGVKQVNNNNVAVNQKNAAIKEQLPKNIIPQPIKNEPVVAVNNDNPTNNLPQPLNNPNINKNDAPNNAVAGVNTSKEIINPKNSSTEVAVTNTTSSPSNIVQASYPEDNADLNQTSGNKNKLRGFFRKVTRTFEKRTNTDATDGDNKLLVAGLSFKMK